MNTKLTVVYHFEDGSWWADSDDVPGYYLGADTLEQLRQRVREGLGFHFEDSVDHFPAPDVELQFLRLVVRAAVVAVHDAPGLQTPGRLTSSDAVASSLPSLSGHCWNDASAKFCVAELGG